MDTFMDVNSVAPMSFYASKSGLFGGEAVLIQWRESW